MSLSLADSHPAEEPEAWRLILHHAPAAVGRLSTSAHAPRKPRGIDVSDPWSVTPAGIGAAAPGPNTTSLEASESMLVPDPARPDGFHRWRPVDTDDPWTGAPSSPVTPALAARASSANANWQ